jgi:carbamoyltransferase
MRHNFLGPEFDGEEIEAVLARYKTVATRLDAPERKAAEMLAGGALVGWFQGRMEFGQRALGNRSILADPRNAATKDKVNAAVKYREGFRPFAPAVPEARVAEYFEVGPECRVPFMERVHFVREEKRHLIPAVVHADGSGRLQTVDPDTNPKFHRLIEAFGAITGVPVVLNTSFNLNGEPVVCTPADALRTFYSCGLDALFLGSYLVEKPGNGA